MIHVPVTRPVAPRRAELRALLAQTVQEVQAPPYNFARALLIVGAYPSVAVASDPTGLEVPAPSPDDLLVSFVTDRTAGYTAGEFTAAGEEEFVTLGSFDSRVGEMHLELGRPGARPTLQVNFRWKRPVVGGPFAPNVIAGLTLLYYWLDEVSP